MKKKMSLFISFFCLLVFACTAIAEEVEIEFDEVVVTGTKSERLVSDVPVRTEIITAKDIELKGAENLYEALEGTPGVRVEQQCSGCNFSQVRMLGLDANTVQVLINGQPVYSGLASVYGLQQIPTANIEKIEIVKGSGSSLYGSSAIAGVINIITKKPSVDEDTQVSVSTTFGEEGTNSYVVSAMGHLGKKADLIFDVQKNTANEIDADGDQFIDRVWSDDIAGAFRLNYYDLLGDDVLTIGGSFINEQRKGGDLIDNAWQDPFAEGSEHIDTNRYGAVLGYSKKFAYDNEINAQVTYTRHEREATNDVLVGDYLDINGVYPPSSILRPFVAEENNYTADFNYSQLFFDAHRLMVGVQYGKNELEETGVYVRSTGDTYQSNSKKESDDIGLYVQDEWEINEALELVIGARYDHHESTDSFAGSANVHLDDVSIDYEEDSVNPRAALKYKPMDSLTLRASAGTGYRVPYNFAEDLHLCSGSPRVYKGAGLEPEKSVSYTLSADYVQSWYMISALLFRVDVEDKIDIADAPADIQSLGYDYEWENLGDAYSQGFELSTQIVLPKDIDIKAFITYTDAKYKNPREDWMGTPYQSASEYISRVPEFAAGVELAWTPGTWTVSLGADWTGEQYIDYYEDDDIDNPGSEIVHADPYWIVNFRVEKEIEKLGLTVFAGAQNLFDEYQEDRRTDDAAFIYMPLYGRIVYAGARVEF